MSKFSVTYSVNELRGIDVEAESKEAALEIINSGSFDDSESEHIETEFLGANDAELIE